MRRAVIEIDPEELVVLLRLPRGSAITSASWHLLTHRVLLEIEHDSLEEVPKGCHAPCVQPRFYW